MRNSGRGEKPKEKFMTWRDAQAYQTQQMETQCQSLGVTRQNYTGR